MQNIRRIDELAQASLRDVMAHLNIMDATISLVGVGGDADVTQTSQEILTRLDQLTYASARLGILEMPRVADALEALVQTARVRHLGCEDEVAATLRHGVDVLMLLTYDAVRRVQGHPAAELGAAVDAFFERVERLLAAPRVSPTDATTAGLESPPAELHGVDHGTTRGDVPQPPLGDPRRIRPSQSRRPHHP